MMDTTAPDPLTLSVQSEDEDGCMSSNSSEFGGTADLMAAAMGDEVTAQLAAAGPVGMAAAAAIVSAKKRKRPHSFETNPSIRKRQQNRLLRKLRFLTLSHGYTRRTPVNRSFIGVCSGLLVFANTSEWLQSHWRETIRIVLIGMSFAVVLCLLFCMFASLTKPLTIDEFATRVGQQAVVLVATPGKPTTSFKCFGAKPLEDVVKNLRSMIMEELESALAQQAPPPVQEDPSLYELPPLIIDGIPTPVEKMTQAQLRAFIPLMLKYSTGRGKPGWGRESTRPPWWPKELPWANVRMDARPEEEKQKCRNLQISWTHALRQIVINCYKYHGREDLLPAFSETEENSSSGGTVAVSQQQTSGTVGVLKFHHNPKAPTPPTPTHTPIPTPTQVTAQYAPAVLQTISNPDGTVSIIQVDPNNPIITLPDGTTAHVQGVATIHTGQGDGGNGTVHAVQTLTEVSGNQDGVAVDLNNVTEATLNQDGQLILTSEDGHGFRAKASEGGKGSEGEIRLIKVAGYPVSVSGMITVPVSASMYQTVVANIQQIHTQGDGTMQVVTPMVHVPKVEPGSGGEVEAITVGTTHQLVAMGSSATGEPQVLQVLSLKDATALTKALTVTSSGEVKNEDPPTITADQ